MLEKGNIVDATIATMFCLGLTTMQSMGIGGGFIMNLFIQKDQKAYTLNAREMAPLQSSPLWYSNPKTRFQGPLSIAVPGEILGYWEMYTRFSSLPWQELIQPTIELCQRGFILTKHMADYLAPKMKENEHFRFMFVNDSTREYFKPGKTIYPSNTLCNTYRLLAKNGGQDFYNGTIANLILIDLKEVGGIITEEDLKNYKVAWSDSIPIEIGNDVLYVTPSPSSGPIVGYLLQILNEFNISQDSDKLLTYHRMAEAFKFSYAKRAELTDPSFYNINKLMNTLTASKEFVRKIRNKIDDLRTHSDSKFYGDYFDRLNEYGTSHLSIIAPNGDAVSVTSSLNFYFGSGICGTRTGIIFNSGIDDFSFTNSTNYFDIPASTKNYIEPQKRSISSMAPIIVKGKNGRIKTVIGAAGGSKIPTSIASVLLRIFWLGLDIKQAIDAPRIHHQLYPAELEYEYGITQEILDGLQKLGHRINRSGHRKSIVNGITKNDSGIFANIDYRKGGGIIGY